MDRNSKGLLAVTQAINEYLSLTGARVCSHDVYGASDHDLKIGLAEHILSALSTEEPGRAEVVEAMARAICDQDGQRWSTLEDAYYGRMRLRDYLRQAEAALSAAEPLLARQDWPKELDASASMPVDFERRYEVKPARADLVEQACKIIYPDLFSDDASTRHRAASPHTVTHAQDTARRHIHSIAGSLATLPTEPASVLKVHSDTCPSWAGKKCCCTGS